MARLSAAALACASLVSLLLPGASASSLHIAGLCRGGMCTDPKFPILDFDKDMNECVCRAHPCWNNKGVSHSCSLTSGFPYLHFTVNNDTELECSCSSPPVYDSMYISKALCAGHSCDSREFPILDWDPNENKCFCRESPCSKVACPAEKPLAHYREDITADGKHEPKCECVERLERPSSKLRGSRSEQAFASCTWNWDRQQVQQIRV